MSVEEKWRGQIDASNELSEELAKLCRQSSTMEMGGKVELLIALLASLPGLLVSHQELTLDCHKERMERDASG